MISQNETSWERGRAVPTLRVSDHTDEGSTGDSQRPVVDDNVLYIHYLGGKLKNAYPLI
jgi:hypothetical protein